MNVLEIDAKLRAMDRERRDLHYYRVHAAEREARAQLKTAAKRLVIALIYGGSQEMLGARIDALLSAWKADGEAREHAQRHRLACGRLG